MKKMEVASLQSTNFGAQTSLQLSDQAFNRILELQAEQDLVDREASIGHERSRKIAGINPQIATEFGETVASSWAKYQKESRGRFAVQGVANMFADASLPFSDDQRRRLVDVYTDAIEAQGSSDPSPGFTDWEDGIPNSNSMKALFEKQHERQVAFDQRIQASAASFLTPAQLELIHKKSELDDDRFRSMIDSMPTVSPQRKDAEDEQPVPMIEC